nr:hypothetical protein [Thermoanaerobacterales bacterium]
MRSGSALIRTKAVSTPPSVDRAGPRPARAGPRPGPERRAGRAGRPRPGGPAGGGGGGPGRRGAGSFKHM